MPAPTFNKWHKEKEKEKKNKKVALHILTHGAMRGCGLTSWVVCTNDKNSWYKEEKSDNKSDIMWVDITEFRVYKDTSHPSNIKIWPPPSPSIGFVANLSQMISS